MNTVAVVTALVAGVAGAAYFAAPRTSMSEQQSKPQSKLNITTESPKRKDKVVKTDEEWRKILTEEQYRILRKAGTEPPFCTVFHDNKKEGSYYCAGCKLELFESTTKFDSGTGWPSFFKPVADDVVWERTDTSHGMIRREVLCARCDGHLGHVFDDGPRDKTGLRYCMNAKAMLFKEKGSTEFEAP